MKLKHRNSQRRIYFEDGVYFVTLYTKYRLPYFKELIFCDLFLEELCLCKKIKGFKLYAWVICYEHVHLLFQPNDEYSYSDVMHFLKRNFSRNMNFIMGYNKNDEIKQPKIRPESDDDHRRFQELLYAFYEFIYIKFILKFRFKLKYLSQKPYHRFRWQKSFIDHITRDDEDFGNHWNYIKNNPSKHGLPDDPPVGRAGWPYVFTNSKYYDLIDQIEL